MAPRLAGNIARFFVSCAYLGYSPLVPGTVGSAFGCLLLLLFPAVCAHPAFVILLALLAIVVINRMELPDKDPHFVVIDEVAGMCATMVGQPMTGLALLKGFILFRLFDILKPFPIRRIERLPKGWGIVADDLAAGIYANIALLILERVW
jgi:phosphatidylglycerophosphatase A